MNRGEEKKAGFRILEGFFIAVLLIVMILVIENMVHRENGTGVGKVSELSEGWYLMEDGKKVEVTLPMAAVQETQEPVILYNDSLSHENAGQTITTRGAVYDLQILLGDQMLYQYSDTPFPRNDQMKSKLDCDAVLPVDMQKDTLALKYFGKPGETCRIDKVYIGSGAAVMSYHYARSAINLGIIFFMALLAVVSIALAIYLYRIKMFDRRFVDVAFFLLVCGIWCATDSSIVQQYSPLAPVIRVISFYAFMLLAIPMLHFVQNTGNMKKYRVIDIFIGLFYLNAAMQGVLNYFGIFEFVEMLFVTHLLLAAGVLALGILLIKENKEQDNRELRTILFAFVMLGASGVLAMILYWLLEIPYYGAIFECGILIFVAMLFGSITVTMAGNIKFKIEMLAYQRLALEDRLTGMRNRRAFEEFLREFQPKAETYENAALIFVRLNRLRKTNNSFGYNVGNELVIALAKCMENAFGECGTCFRLGGAEFCVILPNPAGTPEEWLARLDREIQVYNSSGRYKVSVSRGYSYLRDEEGHVRTISDWKYRADRKMYEDESGKRKG